MKSALRLMILALTLTCASVGLADKKKLDAFLKSRQDPPSEHSVQFIRLHDGVTLYEMNSDKLLRPASVTKLITSAAVLSKLSPTWTFKTGFYHTGKRVNGAINGDLYVVGDGDPFIISEKLWQVAADLKNMGIKDIHGDIVIDNTLFGDAERDASREGGKATSTHAYDAPVSAFGVNFNTFAVAIAPAATSGAPALVGVDPYPLRGLGISNTVRTQGRGDDIRVSRQSVLGGIDEKLMISGNISVASEIKKIYRSVGNHVTMSGEYLRAFLGGAGIIVSGKVREGTLPKQATKLLDLESYSLGFIVNGLNKFSNNYIADVLVKRLGAQFPPSGSSRVGQGTLANGVRVLETFLKGDVGIATPFVLKTGSGLSPENRLSAAQMIKLLAYMEKHFELFPEFLGSLPAAGWDGTLDKRFASGNMRGKVRAKTGTLTEPVAVSGLAGYLRHPRQGLVAFAILENGIAGKAQPTVDALRQRQDQLINLFTSNL